MLSFPAGKHDDMVDMLGLLGQLIEKMWPMRKVIPMSKPKRDGWDKAFAAVDDHPVGWQVL